MADSLTTADEYPLFLELKSIRGALARFQVCFQGLSGRLSSLTPRC